MATGDTASNDDQNQRQSSLSIAEPVACAVNSNGTILCCDGPQLQLEQLCVVCQYFPLSRALLPCRHTCVCAVCFGNKKILSYDFILPILLYTYLQQN